MERTLAFLVLTIAGIFAVNLLMVVEKFFPKLENTIWIALPGTIIGLSTIALFFITLISFAKTLYTGGGW